MALDCSQAMQETMDNLQTAFENQGLLPYSSSCKLILRGHDTTASPSKLSFMHRIPLQLSLFPVADNLAGAVISQIEDILEQVVDCIINKKTELVIHLKSRRRSSKRIPEINCTSSNDLIDRETRAIRFPGRTPQEGWKFSEATKNLSSTLTKWNTAALLRILELSHEALVTGVVTTKRSLPLLACCSHDCSKPQTFSSVQCCCMIDLVPTSPTIFSCLLSTTEIFITEIPNYS